MGCVCETFDRAKSIAMQTIPSKRHDQRAPEVKARTIVRPGVAMPTIRQFKMFMIAQTTNAIMHFSCKLEELTFATRLTLRTFERTKSKVKAPTGPPSVRSTMMPRTTANTIFGFSAFDKEIATMKARQKLMVVPAMFKRGETINCNKIVTIAPITYVANCFFIMFRSKLT